jgi:hypothetical protein
VYHDFTINVQNPFHSGVVVRYDSYQWISWQAREYGLPELMREEMETVGRDMARVRREFVEWTVSNKLVVEIDSFNWFQTWCSRLSEEERAGIRKLTVASQVIFEPPPGAEWNFLRNHDEKLCSDGPWNLYTTPVFELKIRDHGAELEVTSRNKLFDTDMNILRKNLETMLRAKLQGRSSDERFDGNDLLEAMFAFHSKSVHASRNTLVVGPLRKRLFWWKLHLDEGDLDGLDVKNCVGDRPKVFPRLCRPGKTDRHVLFRVRLGESVMPYT